MGNLHPARNERPELTEHELIYITLHTNFTRKQINHFYVRYLSFYPRGYQSPCPKRILTKNFDGFFYPMIQIKTIRFQSFDNLSSDGFIQFDEYLLAIYIHSNQSTIQEKLEWLFHAYDRDRNGFINYRELNEILHALFIFYNIDREQFSVGYATYKIMAILDLNNDDRISKQEFLNMIKDKELTKFLAPSFLKQKQRNEMMMTAL